MKINMAGWDRYFRLILGIVSITWAVAGGPWWAYFGLYLLITGAFRFCPIYAYSKVSTRA